MLKGFLCSRPATDVPVDAGDAAAKVLRIDARSDLVMIIVTLVVTNGLVGGMIGVGVGMLAELGIVVVVEVLNDLLVDTLIGFVTRICVDVLSGVNAITGMKFIDMRVSLKDSLCCFCRAARSC